MPGVISGHFLFKLVQVAKWSTATDSKPVEKSAGVRILSCTLKLYIMEFLNWLNQQNAWRLVGYSLVFLAALNIVVTGIRSVFLIFKRK